MIVRRKFVRNASVFTACSFSSFWLGRGDSVGPAQRSVCERDRERARAAGARQIDIEKRCRKEFKKELAKKEAEFKVHLR